MLPIISTSELALLHIFLLVEIKSTHHFVKTSNLTTSLVHIAPKKSLVHMARGCTLHDAISKALSDIKSISSAYINQQEVHYGLKKIGTRILYVLTNSSWKSGSMLARTPQMPAARHSQPRPWPTRSPQNRPWPLAGS